MVNEEQGLAMKASQMPSVKDVAMMIMQGVSPEELMKSGVPQELVMAAMQMLQQQTPPQAGEAGLANTVVQGIQEGK